LDVKETLVDLLEDTGEEIIGVRPGEKLHETLINFDEMKYSWEFDDVYMISNPIFEKNLIKKSHPGIKKIENMDVYSSETAKKISKDDLKKIIQESGLL